MRIFSFQVIESAPAGIALWQCVAGDKTSAQQSGFSLTSNGKAIRGPPSVWAVWAAADLFAPPTASKPCSSVSLTACELMTGPPDAWRVSFG